MEMSNEICVSSVYVAINQLRPVIFVSFRSLRGAVFVVVIRFFPFFFFLFKEQNKTKTLK